MMLDMKRTFDEIVAAHSDAGPGRADLRQPVLPVAVLLLRRHPGVHGDGEAGPAAGRCDEWDLIVVDTPPSRSALDFLDAPQAAGPLPRRPDDPAAAGAGPGRRPGVPQGRQRRRSALFTGVLTKVLGAQVLRDCRRSWRAGDHVRRLPGAGARRRTSCCRRRAPRSWWSRRRSRTRCARRPTSSTGCGRAHAAGRAGAQPGAHQRRRRRCRPSGAEVGRRRAGRGRRRTTDRRGAAGARRTGPGWPRGDRRMRDRFTGAHPDVPIAEVPALPTDVHDLDGLRRIGAALAG